MCLRFVFLLITRLAAWLRLSRREETWKSAEILILRQLRMFAAKPSWPSTRLAPATGIDSRQRWVPNRVVTKA